jgi:hypothetical protein
MAKNIEGRDPKNNYEVPDMPAKEFLDGIIDEFTKQ